MNSGFIIFGVIIITQLTIVHSILFKSFIEKDSLLSFKVTDIEPFETKSEKYIYDVTNAYFLQPICESIEIDTSLHYKKRNCLMTAIMDVNIIPIEMRKSLEYHFQLNQFIFDFNYSTMTYEIESNEFKFKFVFDVATVEYNKFLPIFSSSFSTEMVPVFNKNIPLKLEQLYSMKFDDQLKDATSVYPQFSTVFNLIEMMRPQFFNRNDYQSKHQLTYCYFTMPEMMKYFIIRDKEVPEKIKVNFEYSVNYNLNYKNGSFIIYDVSFLKDSTDLIQYQNDVNSFEPNEENLIVKLKITDEFKTVLIDSLKQYYTGTKFANSNSIK